MRLKSLEVVGFKSFLDHTTVSFAPGMTAVVGPNGCGKSNVVDAIRWILGEQAPTRLRGKSAEDLIHAGNDAHPAAGMAEVTLTLEADQSSKLPEPYSMLSEAAITRRIYRSGESEYLINKIACRLKDIAEFFMAAQIHSRSFALIEQGRIEEVIQARPQEIRAMLEEAAGLSLFKGRREIGERKLERARENLARVDDVLAEIERQLNYARRQAKKAETYRVARTELSELERFLTARRIFDQRIELALHTERESELRSRADSVRAAVANLQDAADAVARALQAAESDLAAARRELESVHAGAQQRARARDFLSRRLQAISESEPAHAGRIAELEARATLARAAKAAAGAALARAANSCDGGADGQLQDLRLRHGQAQKALRETERRAEELKDEISEVVREAAAVRGRLGDLTGERAELEEQLGSVENAQPALVAALAQRAQALRVGEDELASARAELDALEEAYRNAADGEIAARGTVEQVAAKIVALTDALEGARRRAQAMVEAAGTDQRLRTVLESLNGDGPPASPEILAHVVRAPAGLRPALEAALGKELDAVIVDSPHFALRAIEILKEQRGGRLSFIPQPGEAVIAHRAIEAPGIAGRLLDMLEVEPRFRPVAEAMLGNVMVADDVRAALAASNANGHGTLFVTRDGDVVAPGRMISGGSVEGAFQPHPEDDLEEIASDLARAHAESELLKERLGQRSAERDRSAVALAEARKRAHEAERVAATVRAEVAAADQELHLAEVRLAGARRRLSEIKQLAASSNARLEQLALAEQALRGRLSELREEIAIRRGALEELGGALLEAASKAEAQRAQLAALEQEVRHALQAVVDLDAQIGEHAARLQRAGEERAEFSAELEKLATQEDEARARETALFESVARLEPQCAERGREVEMRRAELKRTHGELQALESEAVECGLGRERARTLAEELARSFGEKFAVDFDSAAEELAAGLARRDPSADESRIAELRARLERIGEVNLAAENEVRELEERATQLGAERADLDRAMKDLTQTITKLNREAQKRFAETFEGAAKNFAEVLPKLLPGARGRLDLEQADELLEAGVNIMIQPAGKRVREIGLLSGGEKALSAIALVFSLFLLNPSPFCVMDEVDAPLDEFRLQAFTSLISELKWRSQFIVITHNQRTMQNADQIYGITMDPPGVSRVISLKLGEAA